MITLQVEPYCQNCPDFEPVKNAITSYAGNVAIERNTVVTCEHKDRCAAVAKFLEEK